MKLVYSRPHICHGREMIWQPHARSWYCPTPRCHRREGVNEYAAPKQPTDAELTRSIVDSVKHLDDQPEPA